MPRLKGMLLPLPVLINRRNSADIVKQARNPQLEDEGVDAVEAAQQEHQQQALRTPN